MLDASYRSTAVFPPPPYTTTINAGIPGCHGQRRRTVLPRDPLPLHLLCFCLAWLGSTRHERGQ